MKHYLKIKTEAQFADRLKTITEPLGVRFENAPRKYPYYGRIQSETIQVENDGCIFQVDIQYESKIPTYTELDEGYEIELFEWREKFGLGVVLERWEVAASRQDWKVQEPTSWVRVDLVRKLTKNQYKMLTKGETPLSMDDKWFVFYELNRLYFVRSWTGKCVFAVDIESDEEGYQITSAYKDPEYQDFGIESLESFLNYRIELGEKVYGK